VSYRLRWPASSTSPFSKWPSASRLRTAYTSHQEGESPTSTWSRAQTCHRHSHLLALRPQYGQSEAAMWKGAIPGQRCRLMRNSIVFQRIKSMYRYSQAGYEELGKVSLSAIHPDLTHRSSHNSAPAISRACKYLISSDSHWQRRGSFRRLSCFGADLNILSCVHNLLRQYHYPTADTAYP
jgi:hypothetical protein